jgi:peptidoglycan hydrolase CwlO-like protein
MLNDEDIKKLSLILATKSDIKDVRDDLDSKFLVLKTDIQDVKKDVEGLREAIQSMMVSIDNLAKVISDLNIEYAAITKQLNKHEDWIKKIAEKVGLDLAVE